MGGCFLGCFGLASERKRRKHAHRVLAGAHARRLSNYEPLSCTPSDLDISRNELRTSKVLVNRKIRKKVRFNLEVQTYEPVSRESGENCFWKDKVQVDGEKVCESIVSKAESVNERKTLYPSNHRYGNFSETDYEEDEFACHESDTEDSDDNEDDYDDDEDYDDAKDDNEDEFALESDERESREEDLLGKTAPPSEAVERLACTQSVLKPIENVEQWKAAKANSRVDSSKKHEKPVENTSPGSQPIMASKPVPEEIQVAASLSSWLKVSAEIQKDNTNTMAKPES